MSIPPPGRRPGLLHEVDPPGPRLEPRLHHRPFRHLRDPRRDGHQQPGLQQAPERPLWRKARTMASATVQSGDHPFPGGGAPPPGPRGPPSICRAAWPTCRILPVWRSTATTDGSWRRIPAPRTATSTEVVPGPWRWPRQSPPCPCLSISRAPFLCLSVNRVYSKRKEAFQRFLEAAVLSLECSLLGIAPFSLEGGVPLGGQTSLDGRGACGAPPRGGCPAFLEDKRGGLWPREGPPPLFPLVGGQRGFLFANWPAAHFSYACDGPPTGWAGWGRWFRRREGKRSPKPSPSGKVPQCAHWGG